MILRPSLTAKILALAVLNLLALAAAAAAFAWIELGGDFDSLLLANGRDRIYAVARSFALDLAGTEPAARDALVRRYETRYGTRIVLALNDGTPLSGGPLPEVVKARLNRPPRPAMPRPPRERGAMPPDSGPPPRFGGDPPMPDSPPFLVLAGPPDRYWIGVRIPVTARGAPAPVPGTLLFASASLLGNPFYFDPRPLVAVAAAALLIACACWLPFVRGVTRSIASLTEASAEIAAGRFDVRVPAGRHDELGDLAHSIARMAERLKLLVHGQKRFLADAAHELRSPLARITVATALVERELPDGPRGHIDDLKEDVAMMAQLVDDLLSFARSELKMLPPARLEAVAVRDVAVRAARAETRTAEIDLAVDPALRALAAPDLLYRAIANLIRNAVQHGAPPIRIAASAEGDAIAIVVADCGAGVPEAELAAIVEPFRRPEQSRSRASGGVGLGLAIVRSAIEACGGSVRCRNLAPHGFEVSIQLRRA